MCLCQGGNVCNACFPIHSCVCDWACNSAVTAGASVLAHQGLRRGHCRGSQLLASGLIQLALITVAQQTQHGLTRWLIDKQAAWTGIKGGLKGSAVVCCHWFLRLTFFPRIEGALITPQVALIMPKQQQNKTKTQQHNVVLRLCGLVLCGYYRYCVPHILPHLFGPLSPFICPVWWWFVCLCSALAFIGLLSGL